MKKLILVAFISLCLFSLVSGAYVLASTKITFWDMFSGGDGEFMSAMIQEFNKTHKDIVVEESVITWADYYNRLLTALAAGKGPDVGIMHVSHIPAYASQNVLMPLDQALSDVSFPVRDFASGPWSAGQYKGKQYGIPLDVHPVVMYYNKDILAKVGVLKDGKPNLPNDSEGFLALLKKIKASTGKIPLSFEANGFGAYRVWFATFYQAGGTLLSDDGKRIMVNNEAGLKTLSWWAKVIKEMGISGMNYDEGVEVFRQGDAALHLNGVWVTGMYEKQPGLNFGAMPFPSLFGGKQSWANSHSFIVPQQRRVDQQKLKAVLTFINWMTANSYKWALAGHIPVRNSVIQSDAFKSLAYRPDYAAQAANLAYLPKSTHILEVESIVSEQIMAAYAGAETPAEALSTIEEKVGKVLVK